jgi:hypothetical protein
MCQVFRYVFKITRSADLIAKLKIISVAHGESLVLNSALESLKRQSLSALTNGKYLIDFTPRMIDHQGKILIK